MTTEPQTLAVDRRPSGLRWKRWLIAAAATFMLLLVLAAVGSYVLASGNNGRVMPGVSIGGVAVGGLSPDDAKHKLNAALPDVSAGSLTVTAGSVQQKINYADIGRAYDFDATIRSAMSFGRQGNPIEQLGDDIRAMTSGVSFTPTVAYDEHALQQRIAQIVATAQVTPVDAKIAFSNGQYVATPASDGQQVNGDEVLRQAIAALNNDQTADTSVVVPATTVGATISTPEAVAAVAKLEAVTSAPLLLTVGATTYTIDPQTLRAWTSVDQSQQGQWNIVVNRAPIDALAVMLKAQIDQPAQEAEFNFDNGKAVAVPGATGYSLDAAASGDAIYNALVGRANGTPTNSITLPVAATNPSFTTQDAQALVARVKVLGEWTTNYVPSPMNNQGQNIRRPATLINGTVVQPSATFDFVGVAGPITEANGYGSGAAIIHGKTKGDGVLGGGLCSASTTMFNAALRAGFELGERRNHAYYIGRYPVGLDATIWISGDYVQTMSFTNDSQYPIVIRGINKKRSVTFQIWGVPDGRTVSLSSPTVTNKQPATEYYEFSDLLPARATQQVEYKADGFDSVVIRTVRDANGNIIHQDTISSSYRKVDGVILVGRYPGDPPAGYRWPVSEGVPAGPGPQPTPTLGASATPKPTNNPSPSTTPKPSKSPTAS
jgi:vancomycin resistance protein YoaR